VFHQNLLDLLKAREPGIWITTSEEKEVMIAVKNAIDTVEEYENVYTWSLTEGINRLTTENNTIHYEQIEGPSLQKLDAMLKESNNSDLPQSRVWILKDYHLAMSNPMAIRSIRDVKECPTGRYTPIIIISPSNEVPLELQKTFKVLNYDTPSEEDIFELLNLWTNSKDITLQSREQTNIAKRLFGFTRSEILSMLNLSFIKYGTINLEIVNEKKIEIINESGVLDYKVPSASLDNVGGNHKFKEWIDVVEACMTEDAREYGIPAPKGYLSVGIPGTSKSFSAEALAGKWEMPFIKLNMAKITSRYAGETERNMYKALNLVRSCAPCVLLIDEVEKALGGYKSSNSSDSGAIARAFGSVLEFLNDNDNGVFVVMTSNDVSQLPPELTRAGRLDAIWFFGLPTKEERKQILDIHLRKANKSVEDDVLEEMAKSMEKYTGAEIELVVKSSLRRAYLEKIKTGEDKGITPEILQAASEEVVPVAVSSREQIAALENWAKNRALYANGANKEKKTRLVNVPKIEVGPGGPRRG
jgi:ATP-dependent 26S proteasome regulatory subunit